MRTIIWQTSFKRDVKKMVRQGKKMNKLVAIFDLLAHDAPLAFAHRDHSLKGNWQGSRELHIAPDWLLIYHIDDNTVFLERTGSHSELFDLGEIRDTIPFFCILGVCHGFRASFCPTICIM